MSPEQLARRRATREAWRERNPHEWRRRRWSGSEPPDRRTAGPSGSPGRRTGDLAGRIAGLEQQLERLTAVVTELQRQVGDYLSYRERERERSRRNRARRRAQSAGTRPAATGTRPAATGTRPVATGTPPLARDMPSGPPPVNSGDSLATTTKARESLVVVSSGTAGQDEAAVWSDPTVLEAVSTRPGLDMRLLRGRVADWLQRHPQAQLTVATVLSFVERWRPGIDEVPPSGTVRRRTGLPDVPLATPAATAYSHDPWADMGRRPPIDPAEVARFYGRPAAAFGGVAT
jgi:hypothetical protein